MTSTHRLGGRAISSRLQLVTTGALALCTVLFSSAAVAIPLIGTNGTNLYRFDSATPNNVTTVSITGMAAGEQLLGLDYRPATGVLYGASKTGRLYTITPGGAATIVGNVFSKFAPSGGTFGTDISAIDDQLRIVSNSSGQNFRVNLTNGEIAGNDAPLSQTGITAISYSNGFPGAATTTCYGIHSPTGTLVRIGSLNSNPNGAENGVVTTIGSLELGSPINQTMGFDIGPTGVGYLAISSGGDLLLYTVNLSTGKATSAGKVDVPTFTTFIGLTAQTGPQTFSNASTILIPNPNAPQSAPDTATPYPSGITVAGMSGVVTKVRVFIKDFRHKKPEQVTMLLVSPDNTRRMVLWSEVGGDTSTCGTICNNEAQPGDEGVTVTLDDDSTKFMPGDEALNCFTCTGDKTYKPTNRGATSFFSPPAPGDGYSYPAPDGSATFASTFYGTEPNGTWKLYVKDPYFAPSGLEDPTGRIADGWAIEVTSAPPCTLSCSNLTRSAMPGQCGTTVNYPVSNVSGACGTLTYSIPSGAMFPVGTTPVEVTSSFGQKCTFNVTVQDFQPPAITCNADITVEAAPGESSAVVTYPPPNASDNCTITSATYDPPSGSSFPIGTTTVTGTAVDSANESVSCTFKVNVLPPGSNPTPTPSGPGTKLANISTRLRVETDDNVLIGGFIVTGAEPKRLLVRGIGPSLSLDDRLLDPNLQLFNSGGDLIAENNNWKDAPNQQEIFDTTIAPSDDLESAVLSTLDPGAYTAVVSGVNGGTGVGLVEAYDLNLNANSKLANIATRGLVQAGDNVMIGGFIVVGPASQKLLVRAIGTSLFIENKLSDPQLQLVDSNGDLVAENDNWRSNQEGEIAATGIPPSEDAESAVLVDVAPAAYTAIVRGANDGTGVGLVEVYALE